MNEYIVSDKISERPTVSRISGKPTQPHLILQEKISNLKPYGDEVYCTNVLQLLKNIRLCSKLHRRKNSNRKSFSIQSSTGEELTWDLSPDSPSRSGHGGWSLPRRVRRNRVVRQMGELVSESAIKQFQRRERCEAWSQRGQDEPASGRRWSHCSGSTALYRNSGARGSADGQDGRYKATWKREFKLPWREAGPPNHLEDEPVGCR